MCRTECTRKSKAATASIKVSDISVFANQDSHRSGTWIPLAEARALADKHGVVERISKIFDYVPGDRSPPPAPKHATAASNKPKTARQPVQRKAPPPVQQTQYRPPPQEFYETESAQYNDEISRDATPESFFHDDGYLPMSQASNASRKRKRDEPDQSDADLAHTLYGDELLDYFVAAGDDSSNNLLAPKPPDNFDVDRPIDTQGNNALHWACAMGDVQVTRDLLARGANAAAANHGSNETPLIRAVLFTNNYDKKTFPRIVDLLASTIVERDAYGATVFHHIAETGRSRGKWSCARYYCEVLINKMQDMGSSYVQALLTSVDANHDTAALCAIRNGCIKVATFLLNHCPESGDIQNLKGETANEYLRALRENRDSLEQPPSSPAYHGTSHQRTKSRRKSTHTNPPNKPISRAASSIYESSHTLLETHRDKLADMYDTEAKEKDSTIADAKRTLTDFEAQRSKIRQETYALLAHPAANEPDDSPELVALRNEHAAARRETESLLERVEHKRLQAIVRAHDEQTPANLFRAAAQQDPNNAAGGAANANANGSAAVPRSALTHAEIAALAPWALELARAQSHRRQLVADVATLLGDANTGDRIGKHRKLVAIATGIQEDQLDDMAGELLDSLRAQVEAGEVVREGRGVSEEFVDAIEGARAEGAAKGLGVGLEVA
jgi:transcription factor MBP1